MVDKRPQADRILVAELFGEARHHAKWRDLTAAEEDAAVAELRDLAGGRADLLAEVAGILEGAREGELDEPLARQAAMLCRKAGADAEAIPLWIEEGRRRRASAKQPPFSGGLHGGGGLRPVRPGALPALSAASGLFGLALPGAPVTAPGCSRHQRARLVAAVDHHGVPGDRAALPARHARWRRHRHPFFHIRSRPGVRPGPASPKLPCP
jgi:hypothetical protein